MVAVLLCTKDTEHHGKLYLDFTICAVLKYWGSTQTIVILHYIEQLALKIVSVLISNILDSLKKGLNVVLAMFSIKFPLR